MNSQQRRLLIAVCFGMVVGPVFGPRLGDWVASLSNDSTWAVLPWLLIAAIWIGLIAWMRRARPTP